MSTDALYLYHGPVVSTVGENLKPSSVLHLLTFCSVFIPQLSWLGVLCRVQSLNAHDGARANHCLGLHGTVVVFSSLLSCQCEASRALPRGGCLIRPERSARATSPSAGDRTSLFSDVSPPGVTRPASPRGLARAGREEDGSCEATLQ